VVKAPTLAAAEEALLVPWPDLDELAADPELLIPPLPGDQSGMVRPAEPLSKP
jgi:hypothetical protein